MQISVGRVSVITKLCSGYNRGILSSVKSCGQSESTQGHLCFCLCLPWEIPHCQPNTALQKHTVKTWDKNTPPNYVRVHKGSHVYAASYGMEMSFISFYWPTFSSQILIKLADHSSCYDPQPSVKWRQYIKFSWLFKQAWLTWYTYINAHTATHCRYLYWLESKLNPSEPERCVPACSPAVTVQLHLTQLSCHTHLHTNLKTHLQHISMTSFIWKSHL